MADDMGDMVDLPKPHVVPERTSLVRWLDEILIQRAARTIKLTYRRGTNVGGVFTETPGQGKVIVWLRDRDAVMEGDVEVEPAVTDFSDFLQARHLYNTLDASASVSNGAALHDEFMWAIELIESR